jgi:uracil-DNA glycosylase
MRRRLPPKMKESADRLQKSLLLERHVDSLRKCRSCPQMQSFPVSGGPVLSRVMLVGQAPGAKEPLLRRPFAWTAGRAMFKWFKEELDIDEDQFRQTVYMSAVCRCFPGKNLNGGDRVPSSEEISLCSRWLSAELLILRPRLVLTVGKLALAQFLDVLPPLTEIVGHSVRMEKLGISFDLIALPHPSGASSWHRIEPGKTLTKKALGLIREHEAWVHRVS